MTLGVLILVVVDDGLVHVRTFANADGRQCLNPCCSGRWSSTTIKVNLRVQNVRS